MPCGFDVVFGGCRSTANGAFFFSSEIGYYWTSTEYNTSNTYCRYFKADENGINRFDYYNYLKYGFSVRCIKD